MRKYYNSLQAYLNAGGTMNRLKSSAGPNASVIGMRKHFWGYHCTIVRVGRYIYKVE